MAIRSVTQGQRYLLWRLPLLATTLLVIAWSADSVRWAAVVSLPLLAGMLAVHLFDTARLEGWVARGYLLAADGAMVALALAATTRTGPQLWIAYCGVFLVAALAGDRLRTLLATAALLGGVAAMGSMLGSQFVLGLETLVHFTFLGCCALSFGTLGELLSGQAEATIRARKETSELWALLEMTDAVGSSLEVGQVMRSIVRLVGDLVDSESCSIVLVDGRLRNCFVVASKGHPEVNKLELDLDKYPEIRRALVTREPVVIEDVESDPLVATAREVLLDKGYRSLLVVPLLFGKEVLGTLFLRARREKPFTPDEIRFCKVAAGTSANALKNALLYREVIEASEQYRATGEKLKRVLDSSPDMIVATDDQGMVSEFNRGAEILTGWSAEQARGRALHQILDVATPLDHPRAKGTVDEPRDVTFRNRDGDEVEISLVSAPLSGPDGAAVGRVWLGRDVTKLRRVEKSLAQAERLSSLGEVVAGVAHELNNPLSSVRGYAQILRSSSEQLEQIRDLERIVESAERCQRIVYKLLSFARRHAPEKRYQNLNDCVSKVLDLKSYHLRTSQITTHLELDPDLPCTSFDFHQIEQVVLNLLNNAEHAIASLKTPGNITLRTGCKDGRVFVQVEDDGPGVPLVIRDRVFDPFFTTKGLGQGTGLGLSVSYGIVEEHGGQIELRNGAGDRGSCFTVWLPLVEEDHATEERPIEVFDAEDRPLRGRRVLVAEDEPLVLELFNRVLSEDGAEVTLAQDGQEAWEQLEASDYDLIVADLRMPNLDGQQLYERVAEERPEMLCRFVFATGDLARPDTIAFLQALPNRIITKPLEVETVRRVLSQVVAGR